MNVEELFKAEYEKFNWLLALDPTHLQVETDSKAIIYAACLIVEAIRKESV